MNRLALIGVSHRRGGAAALEAWQRGLSTAALSELPKQGVREWVPLITCNRCDLVVVLEEDAQLGAVRRGLTPAESPTTPYAYVGDGALEQLTRVAASLDSLNPGEDQIMKQVREAYLAARREGSTGSLTAFAFETALRVAKRVRREVDLAPMHTSLFSLARPALDVALDPGGGVAVVGAGAMGTLAAKSLRASSAKLFIVNRSLERARQLAGHLGATCYGLEHFLQSPPPVQALVCATPVRHLFGQAQLDKFPELRLIIDLGVPRNVDPAAKTRAELLNVDTLQAAGLKRREALTEKLAEAERIVQEELGLALDAWTERQLGPSIRQLKRWYLDTIGDSLPEDEAAKLAHKFAHVPVKGLRALAREYGLDAAKVFLAETGLGGE